MFSTSICTQYWSRWTRKWIPYQLHSIILLPRFWSCCHHMWTSRW